MGLITSIEATLRIYLWNLEPSQTRLNNNVNSNNPSQSVLHLLTFFYSINIKNTAELFAACSLHSNKRCHLQINILHTLRAKAGYKKRHCHGIHTI